jgi:pyruvate/2-oxoglutarate dehydrogenase complex dihydrolipoamide dehydrogenase (E3) component
MTDIYVIQVRYEKNATDGISYFTDKNELADAVYEAENCGGTVQVYKCVPIKHEVYSAKVCIELYED